MITSRDSTSKPIDLPADTGSEIIPPPSYTSHTEVQTCTPAHGALRLVTPLEDDDLSNCAPVLDPIPKSTYLEQSVLNTVDRSSPVRLLMMRLEEKSALTQSTSNFEEIERSARRLFNIDDSASVSVSAEVPSFDNERMIVDPQIWSVVGKEITNVWITLIPRPKRSSKSAVDTHIIEVHIANRYAKTHVFGVQVSRTATIGDLKRAITKRKPKYQVVDLIAQSAFQGVAEGSDVLDEALAYRGRYHFLYDELAFIAHMRAESTKRQNTG